MPLSQGHWASEEYNNRRTLKNYIKFILYF
jgi:hypothetical protein